MTEHPNRNMSVCWPSLGTNREHRTRMLAGKKDPTASRPEGIKGQATDQRLRKRHTRMTVFTNRTAIAFVSCSNITSRRIETVRRV